MAIKRYIAEKDNTITNSFKGNLVTSASLSNMGRADSLQLHVIYGQTLATGSNEIARILIQFPINEISNDILSGNVVSGSGNQQYWLRLFNVEHPETLPLDYKVVVHPLTASWEEGHGLDLDTYTDLGASNWESSSYGNVWGSPGGDFDTTTVFTQSFESGLEDLEINISSVVDDWLNGSLTNNGLVIAMSSSFETGSDSYYKKMFSARGSEFFFKRPCIEVRWNDSLNDDRANTFRSSSLASSEDNISTLYLYNRIRGTYKNIPGIDYGDSIYVSVYSNSSGLGDVLSFTTGGLDKTGIYTASLSINSSGTVYDMWHNNSGVIYHTGTIKIKDFANDYFSIGDKLTTSCTNLKQSYNTNDNARFKFFTKKKNRNFNSYVVVTSDPQVDVIENAYYKISRVIDDEEIIRYGTGSLEYTKLSYNEDGNYFDLDMDLFEPGYLYKINLMFKIDNKYLEQPEEFTFRVESI